MIAGKCCGLNPMPEETGSRVRADMTDAPQGERGCALKAHPQDNQDLIAESAPVPLGVFIETQVPLGTYFQALP